MDCLNATRVRATSTGESCPSAKGNDDLTPRYLNLRREGLPLSKATAVSGILKIAFTASGESSPQPTRRDRQSMTHASAPPSAPIFAEVDNICLRLFDTWCEQRNVLPLAYLMHAWPLVASTTGGSERLCSSLRELATYHPEVLASHERGLIARLADLCEELSGVARKRNEGETHSA